MKLNESKQKVALVQGESFRCTAFQDDVGTWRGIYSGRVLPPVLEVLSEIEQSENMPVQFFRV